MTVALHRHREVARTLRTIRTTIVYWAKLASISADSQTFHVLARGELPGAAEGPPTTLRLRPLGGRPVRARPGTSDAYVVWETFIGRYHLPPPELDDVHVIVDLGANIGLTMAHLAKRHAAATILGVEMDSRAAALCRENVAQWGDRCCVVEAAVWMEDVDVLEYSTTRGAEYGARLLATGRATDGTVSTTRAVSVQSLLDEAGLERVDYMKVDIEGAEQNVLRTNVNWAERVRCLKVEVHEPYSVNQCLADIDALGFEATVDAHHGAAVIGRR